MKYWYVFPFVLFFSFVLPPCALSATESFPVNPPACNLVILVDASDRMAGQIEARTKIDIVREALTGIVKDLPEGVSTRFILQRKRQTSDSDRTEYFASPVLVNKLVITSFIRSLALEGDQPMGLPALEMQDGAGMDAGTILWVSAGQDGSRPDPCPLITKLRGAGGKFSFHVIGLGLSDTGKTGLADFAKSARGVFHVAGNATELGSVLREAVVQVERSAGKLKIAALENGEPGIAYYVLHEVGRGKDGMVETVSEGRLGPVGVLMNLMPGSYDLTIRSLRNCGRRGCRYSRHYHGSRANRRRDRPVFPRRFAASGIPQRPAHSGILRDV